MKEKGLSGSTLKIIAIISMLIDHIGAILLIGHPYYSLCRNIGRIAFPIFCFLLVEGFFHTHDVKKYSIRLLLFALISEIPFDLAFSHTAINPYYQNVFLTLVIGLFVMYGLEHCQIPLWRMLIILAGMAVATLLHTDYSWKGIAAIVVLYCMKENRINQAVAGALTFSWEPPAMLAFLPIYFYNGKRGISLKYLFYAFYPAHLLVLAFVRDIL